MNFWNNIYQHFDPVAFSVGGVSVHWYGLAYVSALLAALFVAHIFIARHGAFFNITAAELDSYFIWAELGVILGARVGYILIYSPFWAFYLTHPWEMFNPFDESGKFVGIAGMSYHGALVGFVVASVWFCYARKKDVWKFMDLAVLSIPLAYVLGRVGNFLNKELFGRVLESDSIFAPFGIIVDGVLRYPSQLIEAFLEGICVFFVLYFLFLWLRSRPHLPSGILLGSYAVAYGFFRFLAEYTREADAHMGYFYTLSMGQILCLLMIFVGAGIIFWRLKNAPSSQEPNAVIASKPRSINNKKSVQRRHCETPRSGVVAINSTTEGDTLESQTDSKSGLSVARGGVVRGTARNDDSKTHPKHKKSRHK